MAETYLSRRGWLAGVGTLFAAAMASRAAAAKRTPKARPGLPVPAGKIPVAIVVDDYTNLMDTACVWEPFLAAGTGPRPRKQQFFEVYLVSSESRIYHTSGNMPGPNGVKFTPNYTFADAPQPKVVVIPSQMTRGEAKREWIRKIEPGADIMMGVCLGSSLFASMGLLDGKSATTHHAYVDEFAEDYPNVKWLHGERVVDEGKYISGGGYTSALDASLYVISLYHGPAVAQDAADWLEYRGDGWKHPLRRLGSS